MSYTPYKAAKVVNAQLKDLGIEKVLPPQMFYTYVAKGFIPSTDKMISEEDLRDWFLKYYNKNFVK
jgi:hypothetical protein